jgi:hypothetical protein
MRGMDRIFTSPFSRHMEASKLHMGIGQQVTMTVNDATGLLRWLYQTFSLKEMPAQ